MFDTSKLKNNKYFVGSYKKGFENRKGWFLGSFFEADNPLKTDQIEIVYKKHSKGEIIEDHYHKEKVEVLIALSGKAKYTINGKGFILKSGDFVFTDVNNVIRGEFLESSEVFAIHSPSLPEDKFKL